MSPSPSSLSNTAVFEYMPQRHVEAFKRTAGHFQAWILVRRGNPQSKKWIGKPGYIPKLLDCKAKTADLEANGEGSTAGLVASPILVPHAFSDQKRKNALKEWPKLEPYLYTFDPKTNLASDKAGKHYTIQMDPKHPHYGCVMYKPVFRSATEYIHGDYDLYAIVPYSDPTANVKVNETGFSGEKHSRSPRLYDVQYFLKAAGVMPGQEFASPMVRHGEQETFKTDWDDVLDVFWPDGRSITELNGSAAIRRFYADTLGGRRQFGDGVTGQPAGGKWVRI
ncbi:MAG TPA: hypothetical protein VKU19_24100 [Bryobacteraceae bacterium]|nr:hypothetical protein [Bryobacteraceae bacterium]